MGIRTGQVKCLLPPLPPFTHTNSLLRRSHTPKPIQAITCDLLILSLTGAFGFVAMDLLIERSEYLVHFQQSWASHFGIQGAEIETR